MKTKLGLLLFIFGCAAFTMKPVTDAQMIFSFVIMMVGSLLYLEKVE